MSTQDQPQLINGTIPEAETIDGISCFGCIHYSVCHIHLDFENLALKHSANVNITLDINTLLGKNCNEYKPNN